MLFITPILIYLFHQDINYYPEMDSETTGFGPHSVQLYSYPPNYRVIPNIFPREDCDSLIRN